KERPLFSDEDYDGKRYYLEGVSSSGARVCLTTGPDLLDLWTRSLQQEGITYCPRNEPGHASDEGTVPFCRGNRAPLTGVSGRSSGKSWHHSCNKD
ncbi:unnamed protein product, partial [Larinioides sclopetarius]